MDERMTGGWWQLLEATEGAVCERCGFAAAVRVEGALCCWPCLAEGLMRDLGALRAERDRLAGLVASHEGVLRCLEVAAGVEREAAATGRRVEEVLAARGVAVRPWR